MLTHTKSCRTEDSYIEYATLHVPNGKLDVYKTIEPWKNFNIIGNIVNAKVKLSKSKATIEKGKTLTLKATVTPETLEDKSVTWESSDPSIATVNENGRVKGIKAGTATITCTSVATGLKGTCTVTVLSNSEARSMNGDDDELTDIKELESSAVIEPFDVYDLSGRKVLHQVTSLDGLSEGIYIVNGKKILKK